MCEAPACNQLPELVTDFEFSVIELAADADVAWRKALEATAIALYRDEHGASPTLQFGRMPRGYRRSSGNNARLVAADRRFRGGPELTADATHLPGRAPLEKLDRDPADPDWGGLPWSAWLPVSTDAVLTRASAVSGVGVYRIRRVGCSRLTYVGEGVIAARLRAHVDKAARVDHPQAAEFAGAIEVSAAALTLHSHERLEVENDLIGAHVLLHGAPPAAQFGG